MKKMLLLSVALSGVVGLSSGCAPLVIGGAAVATGTTVATMTDRRSTGSVVNDEVIESRVGWEISEQIRDVDSHITVTSYNGWVLLSGEIATQEAKDIATETASKSLEVSKVINELVVQEKASITQRLNDSALATKVRSRIVGTENVYLNQMKVVAERGIIYLMGMVTAEENQRACEVASKTSGVSQVVSLCEVLTAEEIEQRMKLLQQQQSSTTNSSESESL